MNGNDFLGVFIIHGSELLLSGKTLATGSAKRDLYAKPTASRLAAQLWVGKGARAVPRSATYAIGCQQDVQVPLRGTLSSHTLVPTAAPQGGLQWVSHRGVPSAHPVRIKSVMYFSSKPANFKLLNPNSYYAIVRYLPLTSGEA